MTDQDLEVLQSFMSLGKPQGNLLAYFDMHPDDIIIREGKVMVTVGDIRALQDFLAAHGVEQRDRLTMLMRKLPEGTKQ